MIAPINLHTTVRLKIYGNETQNHVKLRFAYKAIDELSDNITDAIH